MAPMAARRAKPVQRSHLQGLQSNPDACRPGRGSAWSLTSRKTCGDAGPVSALSVQPAAAGCTVPGGLAEAEAAVLDAIRKVQAGA